MHTDSEAAESAKLNVLRQGVAKTHWFLYSSIWLNFCEILTFFAQVMVSEASGTNYDGYIHYRL